MSIKNLNKVCENCRKEIATAIRFKRYLCQKCFYDLKIQVYACSFCGGKAAVWRGRHYKLCIKCNEKYITGDLFNRRCMIEKGIRDYLSNKKTQENLSVKQDRT